MKTKLTKTPKVSKTTGLLLFPVDNTWRPRRVIPDKKNVLFKSAISQARSLAPESSFLIGESLIRIYMGSKNMQSAVYTLRRYFVGQMGARAAENFSFHIIKDVEKKPIGIRIRRREGN